ncbi:hypothetical protein [Mycobacterium paraterrae]|uniref:Lipoprotein n=1 Tax=Mycobacterium paraterrae TaxID=577492 RepID=A0ABY3VRN3_9MYCO|nr:hypothetical protein [Mycobacterium paraterrae]UMB71263.1 hypothetical protein MKK62_08445 [Mycobacterium paraterrae]
MRTMIARFSAAYGDNPLHLLGTIAAGALAGYVVVLLGPHHLWNTKVWWQSIAVWFAGAIIGHDLILFPLYALADLSLRRAVSAVGRHRRRLDTRSPTVAPLNYVRVPTLATGLCLLLFFPGIIQQGHLSYVAATGQDQQPFLGRWLLLTAAAYGAAALAYATRLALVTWRAGSDTQRPR